MDSIENSEQMPIIFTSDDLLFELQSFCVGDDLLRMALLYPLHSDSLLQRFRVIAQDQEDPSHIFGFADNDFFSSKVRLDIQKSILDGEEVLGVIDGNYIFEEIVYDPFVIVPFQVCDLGGNRMWCELVYTGAYGVAMLSSNGIFSLIIDEADGYLTASHCGLTGHDMNVIIINEVKKVLHLTAREYEFAWDERDPCSHIVACISDNEVFIWGRDYCHTHCVRKKFEGEKIVDIAFTTIGSKDLLEIEVYCLLEGNRAVRVAVTSRLEKRKILDFENEKDFKLRTLADFDEGYDRSLKTILPERIL